MIDLYSGTPGSGKSLHTAKVMMDWMTRWKSPVIANFPFRAKAVHPKGYGSFLYVPNHKLNPEMLLDFSEQYKKLRGWSAVPEETILLVIDECQIIFNSRSWQQADRSSWISFFSQHRKAGYRIILVAQFDRMIDRQIRSLIEYEHIHRKVKNIGLKGKILNTCAGGSLHIDIKLYKPLNEKVGRTFFKADRQICALYDSYAKFSEDGAGD